MRKEVESTMNKTTIYLILIVLLNLIIKGLFLSSNSIGGDEPYSIYHAQMDIVSIVKLLSTGNNPPLYEIILHFWVKLFGISAFSTRLPSLFFSCITVLFIYKIGIRFFNLKVAVLSGLLFVFSNYQIIFSHEARVYALFGMLTAISMYYYLSLIIKEKPGIMELILLLMVNIALIYSHYFGFFVLLVQFLYLILDKGRWVKYRKQIFIAMGIIALFYLPNIGILIKRFIVSSSEGTWIDRPYGLDSIYIMLRQFTNEPVVTVIVILLLAAAILKYFINRKQNDVGTAGKVVVLWFVLPFFLMFFISYLVPMFLDRYLIFVSISFYLIIAIAIDYLFRKKSFSYAVMTIVCILFIVTVKPNITNKRDVKETVQEINELRQGNTLVIFCPQRFMLNYAYYHDIDLFKKFDNKKIYRKIEKELNKENIYGVNNISKVPLKGWFHIIYLDAGADYSFPKNNILNTLNRQFELKDKYEFYQIFKVYEYVLKGKVSNSSEYEKDQ
jgi:mannosyltransferase